MSFHYNREPTETAWVIDESGETFYLPPKPETIAESVQRAIKAIEAEQALRDAEKDAAEALAQAKCEEERRRARSLPFARKLAWEVADELGLEYAKVVGKSRKNRYHEARAIVWTLLREKDPKRYSYPQIGKLFANRDHSTIIYGVKSFPMYCKRNPKLFSIYKALGGNAD